MQDTLSADECKKPYQQPVLKVIDLAKATAGGQPGAPENGTSFQIS